MIQTVGAYRMVGDEAIWGMPKSEPKASKNVLAKQAKITHS